MGVVWRLALLWLVSLLSSHNALAEGFSLAVQRGLTQAHLNTGALAQPSVDTTTSTGWLRRFMSDPPAAWRDVDGWRQLPAWRNQPAEIYRRLLAQATPGLPVTGHAPVAAAPPPTVPVDLPEPLASELRRALHGLVLADRWRAHALSRWPESWTPETLIAQTLPAAARRETPALPPHWPSADRLALRTGMRILLATAERLHTFVTQTPDLPPVTWRSDTPWGTVLVDTTGQSSHHQLERPFLVLDVGGDDHYTFDTAGPLLPGVRLLMDHGGHDRYHSRTPGSDPSAAVMGLALLWDTEGNDDYQAGWLGQGAALAGAAVHIDDAGHNRYTAAGMAQGFALGGDALLLGSPGRDDHQALTLAQASAGPLGLALLLDPGGDDRYQLSNEVVVWPSSQLPEHNASMGQGAGYGTGRSSSEGGVAVLIDAAGDDLFRAQLFAQGAGLRQGLGALLDLGGHNHHQAVWYAMGAAAHEGVGLLWSAGAGDDRYEVSHVSAMGAGHDLAVGMLVDAGGVDRFVLGDLGLGAAHDGGHGVLVRAGGTATYRWHTTTPCRGGGQAHASAGHTTAPGLGLFVDASRPSPCPRAPSAVGP